MYHKNNITMHDHLILISRERIIGTEIDETSNLIYTEVRIRTKKHDANYRQCDVKKYKHLVERELTSTEIYNFIENRHLYTKVESNEYGVIYQYGKDFKKMYWEMFPKPKEKKEKVKKYKVCSKCKKKLPVTDFYVDHRGIIYSACKKCRLNISKIKYKELSLQKSI